MERANSGTVGHGHGVPQTETLQHGWKSSLLILKSCDVNGEQTMSLLPLRLFLEFLFPTNYRL